MREFDQDRITFSRIGRNQCEIKINGNTVGFLSKNKRNLWIVTPEVKKTDPQIQFLLGDEVSQTWKTFRIAKKELKLALRPYTDCPYGRPFLSFFLEMYEV